MKFLSASLLLLFTNFMCFPTLASASIPYDKFPADPAIMAPDFQLPSLTEDTIRLSDFRGKIVLLNFWATFCAPCRMEMPSLQILSDQYQDSDVVIIAVSLDEGRKRAIKKWITKIGLEFPIALEGETAGDDYEVSSLPVTFIIGKEGQLIGRMLGERKWDSVETRELIETLLSQSERYTP
ncbi:hypothetical protein A9R00_06130 [Oleispira antarctica]|uniref:Thioredoxin domain-containing protein n=1 Tax=Oleispira antarctica TaxID=188908 RepID=A0A1Y5HSY3_OLEAN|nr:hypothetical protein A9R00_06130 [Oleispira antarctica]